MPDPNDPEALLIDFADWLTTPGKGSSVGSFLDRYQTHLAESIGEASAREAVGRIMKMMGEQTDLWAPLFDRIYSAPDAGFNIDPNQLLVEVVDGVTPGTAIDIAMGQGRNAVYLASRGWTVTGIDISPVGVETAKRAAQSRGLSVEAIAVGHDDYDLGHEMWDLMVFTYTPVKLAHPDTVTRIGQALKPGGRIVVESFKKMEEGPSRPVDLVHDELASAYSSFHVDKLAIVEKVPDWDDVSHPVVQMVAVKPDVGSG